jgi:hypothetical protein
MFAEIIAPTAAYQVAAQLGGVDTVLSPSHVLQAHVTSN